METHEKLILNINITRLNTFARRKKDKLRLTKDGESFITLFCDVRKETGEFGETHSISAGYLNRCKYYVGSARPTKNQPDINTKEPEEDSFW